MLMLLTILTYQINNVKEEKIHPSNSEENHGITHRHLLAGFSKNNISSRIIINNNNSGIINNNNNSNLSTFDDIIRQWDVGENQLLQPEDEKVFWSQQAENTVPQGNSKQNFIYSKGPEQKQNFIFILLYLSYIINFCEIKTYYMLHLSR